MEISEKKQEEEADAPKSTEAQDQDQNDASETLQENKTPSSMEQENDDEFGDFAAPSDVAESEQTEQAKPSSGDDDKLVSFEKLADTCTGFQCKKDDGENADQTEPSSGALDDPFAHLSATIDGDALKPKAIEIQAGPDAVPSTNEAIMETNAVVSSGEAETTLTDDNDNVGYFDTHAGNLKERDSGIDSESGQDSLRENDAGYFSAADGGDDKEEQKEHIQSVSERSTDDPAHVVEPAPKPSLKDDASDSNAPEQQLMAKGDEHDVEVEGNEDDTRIKESVETEAEKDEEEDFGDFGSFEQPVTVESSESVSAPIAAGDTLEISPKTSGDVDTIQTEHISASVDFSKEKAAMRQEDEERAAPEVADDEDDDIGDFGSFEQAVEAITPVADEPVSAPETDDDDFGDFGAFEQAEEGLVNDEPSPEVPRESAPVDQQEEDDDDFGDFGDFTDFASEAPVAETRESSTNDNAAVDTKPSPSVQSPVAVVDPVVAKAETIFSEVFGRSNGAVIKSDQSDALERVAVKVNSALDDVDTNVVDDSPSQWYLDSLASVMRGVEHLDASGPIAVANQSSQYPYAHFTVPVCGLPVTKVDIQGRSSARPRSKQSAEMSAFCQVERVVGPSFSAESVESVQSAPPAQESTGTVVSLPPSKSKPDTARENGTIPQDAAFANLKSSGDTAKSLDTTQGSTSVSNGNKEVLSPSAKQFLQQIPDLSFMLKSTLSLPKKS